MSRLIVAILFTTVTLFPSVLLQPLSRDEQLMLEIMKNKCPAVCSGKLNDSNLKKICTCVYREGAFLYGKRGSLKEDRPEDIKQLASGSEEKSNGDWTELEQILNRKRKPSADHAGQMESDSYYQPHPRASDYETLRDLLTANEQTDNGEMRQQIAEEKLEMTTPDLFKAEIGADERLARKEHYLHWVEKEMKISELRLKKLMKFHEFIKLTLDDQWKK